MARYEFTSGQVENLKAILMDANIKGSAAQTIVDLVERLDNPVDERKSNDLHSEHNDQKGPTKDKPKKDRRKRH